MNMLMRFWYLWPIRAAKVLARLCKQADLFGFSLLTSLGGTSFEACTKCFYGKII